MKLKLKCQHDFNYNEVNITEINPLKHTLPTGECLTNIAIMARIYIVLT